MSSECEPLCRGCSPLKRTILPPRCRAQACSVLLTLSLVVVAACSGTGGPDGDVKDKYNMEYGLKKSELRALKKANKSHDNFNKVLLEKKLEKLKSEGVTVETKTSQKTANRPR